MLKPLARLWNWRTKRKDDVKVLGNLVAEMQKSRREQEISAQPLPATMKMWFGAMWVFLPLVFCFLSPALASAADLETIQQRGYLIVAVKDNRRPLGFRDEAGLLQGLEIDIAKRLAQELLGREDAVQLQPVTNSERLSAVLEGRVDLTVAGVTATEGRQRLVSFSIPYYADGAGLLVKAPSVRQLKDLAEQTIAVIEGSSTILALRYYLPNAKLVSVNSYEAGRLLLDRGTVTAFAGDVSVLAGWVQEFPQYHLLPTVMSEEPLSAVMPKGLQYREFRERVNEAIARWYAEGWLQERNAYWGLPNR